MKDLQKTRARALFYLGKRAYGVEELRQKLYDKDFEKESVDTVIDEFIQDRLFDDEDFIAQWLELIAERRRYGYLKIKKMLREKHFTDLQIDKVFRRTYADKEREIALEAAEAKKAFLRNEEPLKQKQKVVRFLASRGFGSDTVISVMETLF